MTAVRAPACAEREATCVSWGKAEGRVRFEDGSEVPVKIGSSAARGRVCSPIVGARVLVRARFDGSLAVWPLELKRPPTDLPWRAPAAPLPPEPLPGALARAVAAALACGESAWTIAERHGLPVARVRASR